MGGRNALRQSLSVSQRRAHRSLKRSGNGGALAGQPRLIALNVCARWSGAAENEGEAQYA